MECDTCTLQIISVMTDKLNKTHNCCYYPHTAPNPESLILCFSVYHSCANIKIKGGSKTAQEFFDEHKDKLAIDGAPKVYGSYGMGAATAKWTDKDEEGYYTLSEEAYRKSWVSNKCPGFHIGEYVEDEDSSNTAASSTARYCTLALMGTILMVTSLLVF